MVRLILKAVLLVALPAIICLGGAGAIFRLAGWQYLTHQLWEKADDRKPLYNRYKGYDLARVERFWDALDQNELAIEQRFLKFDLIFPFLYGATLAGALLLAWKVLGRQVHPLCLILISPVVITVLADWTENIVQLSQLQFYLEKGKSGLQAAWIQIASTATVLKLFFFIISWLLLMCLAFYPVVYNCIRRRRNRAMPNNA